MWHRILVGGSWFGLRFIESLQCTIFDVWFQLLPDTMYQLIKAQNYQTKILYTILEQNIALWHGFVQKNENECPIEARPRNKELYDSVLIFCDD